jgi:peptidoglycan hydrolase CwlO-like protein
MKYFFLCLLGLVVVSGCVTPEQYQLLENRITAVEMGENGQASVGEKTSQVQDDLDSFQMKLEDSSKLNRENYAEVKDEIEQIKAKFQQVEGLIEEINHNFGIDNKTRQEELEKRLDRLDNTISRNYEKVINLEKYMGFEPGEIKSAENNSGETKPAEPEPPEGPQEPTDPGDTDDTDDTDEEAA